MPFQYDINAPAKAVGGWGGGIEGDGVWGRGERVILIRKQAYCKKKKKKTTAEEMDERDREERETGVKAKLKKGHNL